MTKNKYYRVTETSGKRWKGTFEKKITVIGINCFMFTFTHNIIDISLIKKIEEVEVISKDTIAREQDCWKEFCSYGTVNGVKIKKRYKYKEINFKRESK